MSTRATIMITYEAGNTIQLYHHHDGYPEYMGKMLETFANAAHFCKYGNGGIDGAFYNMLKMEKGFEFEKRGIIHTDVEYFWYVTLSEDGYDITYTSVNPLKDPLYAIENDDEYCDKVDELYKKLIAANKGTELYA